MKNQINEPTLNQFFHKNHQFFLFENLQKPQNPRFVCFWKYYEPEPDVLRFQTIKENWNQRFFHF
jgi:hypothetical protein